MNFLSIQGYIIGIVVAVVVLQYAFALFCLLKLAYTDVSKKQYILWNLLILIVFFIGGAAFLIYYYRHPDKRVSKDIPSSVATADSADKTENSSAENTDEPEQDSDVDPDDGDSTADSE